MPNAEKKHIVSTYNISKAKFGQLTAANRYVQNIIAVCCALGYPIYILRVYFLTHVSLAFHKLTYID